MLESPFRLTSYFADIEVPAMKRLSETHNASITFR
jgi:hypothetical protein